MRKPHSQCPICFNNLNQEKCINAYYPQLMALGSSGGKLSFIKATCSTTSQRFNFVEPPFLHYYIQISSLYGELLLENILFVEDHYEIDINYIKSKTIIQYNGINSTDNIKLNKIIELDYPNLNYVKQKINSLALFM